MELTWIEAMIFFGGMLIPGIFALTGAYLAFKNENLKVERRVRSEMRIHAFANYIQLRVTAHERLILYLERMKPESLLLRNQPTEHNAQILEALMLQELQAEFEHNVVQQLYIEPDTWRLIEKAKTELMLIIQHSTQVVGDQSPGLKLAEQITLDIQGMENGIALFAAIDALKFDLKDTFK
jgi:hypothetical protein